MKSDRELTGLEGWLALVGIGLVLAPIRSLWAFIQTFPPLFRDGTWRALTEPDSVSYHPLWAPVLLGEITFNIAIIFASGCLLYLFFKKHFWFPRAFIVVLLAGLSFQLADAFVVRNARVKCARDGRCAADTCWPQLGPSRRVRGSTGRREAASACRGGCLRVSIVRIGSDASPPYPWR